MARHFAYNEFNSISHLCAAFKTTLPKPATWRLLSPAMVGEINALPGSKGIAIATNGILVAILQNTSLFIGHFDSFVVEQVVETDKQGKKQTANKPKIDIMDFI